MTEAPHLIYISPLVLPITGEPIADGAVALSDDSIVDVGARHSLVDKWPQARTVELAGLLMPPLVNGHMHMELAGIGDIPRPRKGAPMTDWIAMLMERRTEEAAAQAESAAAAAEQAGLEQYRSGVALVADISNTIATRDVAGDELPEIYRLRELTAPTITRSDEALRLLENMPARQPVCAHAPYSTTARLIVALKNRARQNGHLFSLHVAESADEKRFLGSAEGPFRAFLEERGGWDGDILGGGTFEGSIFYLDSLGVLDGQTLCVHCVHVSEAEIGVLARRRAKVCLCPGSNDFLGVGTAPLEKMLQAGLVPAIGTDSSASNEKTDLWREIGILRRRHPTVAAATLLAMATYGGAAALGRTGDYGGLEKGKKPLLLEVDVAVDDREDADGVMEQLVRGRRPENIRWRTPLQRC